MLVRNMVNGLSKLCRALVLMSLDCSSFSPLQVVKHTRHFHEDGLTLHPPIKQEQ